MHLKKQHCLVYMGLGRVQNTPIGCGNHFPTSRIIFHVTILPVLPYMTRYMFTYIGQYTYCLFLKFPKPSNVHTNTFHASNPAILPYNVQNPSVADLVWGVGILPYFIPYIGVDSSKHRKPPSDFHEMSRFCNGFVNYLALVP